MKFKQQFGIYLTAPYKGSEVCHKHYRVKSDNVGHQVNSDIHLQTVEISR